MVAPIFSEMPHYSWSRCREIVLDAYHAFSPRAGEVVELFFRKAWIDAELRVGKMSGGFSTPTVPSVHPYVLINFTDTARDVMITAHELGHALHQYLRREVGFLQSRTPLTMAETASVFGEMLVFNRLLETAGTERERLTLLVSKIENIFTTSFRQVALTDFEKKLHGTRRREGELTTERISAMWMESHKAMVGDSVELTPDYAWRWSYIPHFIRSPFYCYAYAFGELLALSLFKKYRNEGESFVPAYLELLTRGGSDSPDALLSPLGVDIREPNFWKAGVHLIEDMVHEAERLSALIS
jgi:oligoendopeptidase F